MGSEMCIRDSNNTDQPQKTTVTLADGTTEDFDLPDSGIAWREA